jgi:putative ABC transport system permease protein
MRRFYRTLLRLFPSSFQAEYGREMEAITLDRWRRASSLKARAGVLLDAVADLVGNGLRTHIDLLGHDLRYAARTPSRSPGFVLTVVLVTALGIGANIAVFTVTDSVLVRPLPFPEPDRLVKLWENPPGYRYMELSAANYRDWKERSTSFEAMEAFTGAPANLSGTGNPQLLRGVVATPPTLSLT